MIAAVYLRNAPSVGPAVGAVALMVDGEWCALDTAREEEAKMSHAKLALCR
jgi:hypothetical protein